MQGFRFMQKEMVWLNMLMQMKFMFVTTGMKMRNW